MVGAGAVEHHDVVVTVALPAIQSDLNVSVQGAQWIVNGYMLMLGALILVGGSAGDRFGRRRVFALGAAIFSEGGDFGCTYRRDINIGSGIHGPYNRVPQLL
jgi:MFS family permease